MNILERAIQVEDGVGKLAEALGVRQNVVSNWRKRRVPKAWQQVLELKYPQAGSAPLSASQQEASHA